MTDAVTRFGRVRLKGRANVVRLPGIELDPATVLAEAMEHGLDDVIVIGYDRTGNEVFISSIPDAPSVSWLLLRALNALSDTVDDMIAEGHGD